MDLNLVKMAQNFRIDPKVLLTSDIPQGVLEVGSTHTVQDLEYFKKRHFLVQNRFDLEKINLEMDLKLVKLVTKNRFDKNRIE